MSAMHQSQLRDLNGTNCHADETSEHSVHMEESILENQDVYEEGSVWRTRFSKVIFVKIFGKESCDLCYGNQAERKHSVYVVSVRRSAYLLIAQNIAHLVISSNHFFLDFGNESSRSFLSSFVRRLVSGSRGNTQIVYNSAEDLLKTETSSETNRTNNPNLLKLTVLELVLVVASFQLNKDSEALFQVKTKLASLPDDQITSSTFETIEKMKEACEELKSKADVVKELLTDIRDNERTLFDLDLVFRFPRENNSPLFEVDSLRQEQPSEDNGWTRKRSEEEEKVVEEVKDMLRYSRHRTINVRLNANYLLDHADSFESSSKLTIAILNYQATKFGVKLSIIALACSCGALVSGILGMNMKGFESQLIRGIFSILLIITCLLILFSFRFYSKKRR